MCTRYTAYRTSSKALVSCDTIRFHITNRQLFSTKFRYELEKPAVNDGRVFKGGGNLTRANFMKSANQKLGNPRKFGRDQRESGIKKKEPLVQ